MFTEKNIYRFSAVLISLLLLSSCSTKKNTFNRRAYHNLTCHYNVYWNGNESLKSGLKEFSATVIDDYSNVLRVYNYGTAAEAQKMNSSMDRAIQKASIGVQKHSMKFNNVERVRWIDDSYLMMGKAHFLKQDYVSARRTFDFVANQFSYNDITYTANLWMAKTYIQLEQYQKADAILQSILSKAKDIEMPKEVQRNIDFVQADFYIATQKYDKAIPYLKDGILLSKSRKLNTRSMFILGQVYQRQGDLTRALEQFHHVIKRNPSYELEFESKINLAKAYDNTSGDSKQIIKILQKMLRDIKNESFKDKIYFALAEVAFKDGDEHLGIDYLKKSVASNAGNKNQQVISSLTLADILFEKEDYMDSQAYYDTAVSAMDKKYPGYDSIFERSQILNDLVENLVLIKTNDSLLRIAQMDSVSRIKVIDKIIQEYVAAEAERKKQEQIAEQMAILGQTNKSNTASATSTATSSADWYFYNPNTLSYGYTEFLRKWGRRKLEDNWRISDKPSIALIESGFNAEESEEIEGADTLKKDLTPTDRDYYLLELPLTEEAQQIANEEIVEAFNNAGYIYMERLEDYTRSIDAYKQLNERYPENQFKLQSWYSLYKLYTFENQIDQSEIYKNQILTKYPDSDYARVILDPEYFIKLAQQKGESYELYEKTYEAYKQGQYYRVKLNADRARMFYKSDTALIPRFEFLRAIAVGRLEVVDSMAVSLDKLIKEYPESSVSLFALDILRGVNAEYELNMKIPELPGDTIQKEEVKKSPYKYEPAVKHYLMIVSKTAKVKTDPLKIRISDFNKREYNIKGLSIKSLMLNEGNDIITINEFENLNEANLYFTNIKSSDYVFGGMNETDFEIYPISVNNYPIFYREKNLGEYKEFFENIK